MNNEYLELKKELEDNIEERNQLLLSKMTLGGKKKLFSKEFLSILHSECLLSDLDYIESIASQNVSSRYINLVVRNICEQVIEYKYLIQNPDKIGNYFGEDAPISDSDTSESEENSSTGELIDRFKKCVGKKRYGNSIRPRVYDMAKTVDETDSTEEKMSLYDIYCISSELVHSSYFHAGLELIGEIENEEDDNNELLKIFLIYLITAFLDTYNDV